MKIDLDEFLWQLEKEMTLAREEGKNHTYRKGLRDAGKIAKSMGEEEKVNEEDIKQCQNK